MAVTLYRQVGKGKDRRYKRVNLGPGRRPADLSDPYFLRYSLADGTCPWEPVGDDLDAAIEAQKRKQAYFEALDANASPSSKTKTKPGGRKSPTPCFSGSLSFRFFRAKTNKGKAGRPCKLTTIVWDSFLTSPPSRTCGSSTRSTAPSFCAT